MCRGCTSGEVSFQAICSSANTKEFKGENKYFICDLKQTEKAKREKISAVLVLISQSTSKRQKLWGWKSYAAWIYIGFLKFSGFDFSHAVTCGTFRAQIRTQSTISMNHSRPTLHRRFPFQLPRISLFFHRNTLDSLATKYSPLTPFSAS
jgi:hypothetical protein